VADKMKVVLSLVISVVQMFLLETLAVVDGKESD